METPHLFTSKEFLLDSILPPELWDIIFYCKWELEMKDMYDDKDLLDKYIDEKEECHSYKDINIILEKTIPESKLIFTHIDSNICYHGRECTLYIKSLIRWKNYYIIYEYDNEGYELDVKDISLSTYYFKLIHIDSYNDDVFLTENVLNTMSLPNIIEYFKNSNRNLEDVISYIDKKYIHA
jgi:hypothetical protein